MKTNQHIVTGGSTLLQVTLDYEGIGVIIDPTDVSYAPMFTTTVPTLYEQSTHYFDTFEELKQKILNQDILNVLQSLFNNNGKVVFIPVKCLGEYGYLIVQLQHVDKLKVQLTHDGVKQCELRGIQIDTINRGAACYKGTHLQTIIDQYDNQVHI